MGIFVVFAWEWFCWTALLFSSWPGPCLASSLDGIWLNVGDWEHLQRNVGEWRGWFDSLDRTLQRTKRQRSLLTLEPAPSGLPLNLTLLLWPEEAGSSSPHQPPAGEPEKRIVQSFTRLDPDMGVFGTGSFSRGTLYRSTWTKLYAEFGFLHHQRRHRLVLLWDGAGRLDRIVLIREFLSGSSAVERPSLEADQLISDWRCDLPTPGDNICFAASDLDRWIFLPDGGAFLAPAQIDSHQPFSIEALWLSSATRLERISRRYSEHGALTSVNHQLLTR